MVADTLSVRILQPYPFLSHKTKTQYGVPEEGKARRNDRDNVFKSMGRVSHPEVGKVQLYYSLENRGDKHFNVSHTWLFQWDCSPVYMLHWLQLHQQLKCFKSRWLTWCVLGVSHTMWCETELISVSSQREKTRAWAVWSAPLPCFIGCHIHFKLQQLLIWK